MFTFLWKIFKWLLIIALGTTLLAFISFALIGIAIELFGEAAAYLLGGAFAVIVCLIPIGLICKK